MTQTQQRSADGSGAPQPAPISHQSAFVALAPGVYRLEAPLQFATVPALRPQGLHLISSSHGELTIELSAVPRADSAGLALLIDWLAGARARQQKLRYVQPPETLLALARLSEVEQLITA